MDEKTKRSASLTFRGFLKSPEEVESLVGVKAVLLAQSGQPKKPNRPNVWPRSVAMFQVEFENNAQIVDMIPAILAHLGGIDRVRGVLEQISPEFLEVNLVLPVRYSEAQEDGYVEAQAVQDLAELGATLGLSVV
ncbi:hypothetical protein GE543_13320 [Pseudomonas sp. SZ57]|uniref:hypothetical protein n=1 Tax=Pseudomonas sp. SZ57 TaxID=2662259 RepID=UPI00129292AB|nr:hypothetical protein [Pseudomonas sp. SZ57]MQQ35286.1 hypothetical protein [Pseudomonas sp. SZ57]